MHNTLEEFNKYIAEILFNYFDATAPLQAGDKYYIRFQDEDAVAACRAQLLTYRPSSVSDFQYQHDAENKPFNSHQITIGTVQLIVAASTDATEHYLTLLRNQVADQEGQFAQTAILILYHKQLDSLGGGSGDLTKSGMPLSFGALESNIEQKIEDNFHNQLDKKAILNLAFKNKKSEFRLGDLNIFDFQYIIAIASSGKFDKTDYQLVGLFPHFELTTINDSSKIEEKIEENNHLFEQIEHVVNYGNVLTDLDKVLTAEGVRAIDRGLADESWKLHDFAIVQGYKMKPERVKPVEFEGLERNLLGSTLEIWLRKDAKNGRTRHLIFFNQEGQYPFKQRFNFSESLKGNVQISSGPNLATVAKTGKQLEVTVLGPAYNEEMIYLEYADAKIPAVKYRFRIWVINGSAAAFAGYQSGYYLEEGIWTIDVEESVKFNREASEGPKLPMVIESIYELNDTESLTLLLEEQDEDIIPFQLNYREQTLALCIKQQVGVSRPTRGWVVWQDKRIEQEHYQYEFNAEQETLKLYFQGEEYGVRDQYRKDLLCEVALMQQPASAWEELEDGSIVSRTLQISDRLLRAYEGYVSHIAAAGTLPSLFYLHDDARAAAIQYVDTFQAEFNEIQEDSILPAASKADMILLGTVAMTYGRQVVKFSPLHPLMVAYQLELYQQVKQHRLYESMLKKLTPLNLLPYFYWRNQQGERQLYASKENNQSPEWQYYSSDLHFKQFSGREFIRDLVSEKIKDFISNFFFLFSYDSRVPLRINVFNMGDCLQILQGIFDYYKERALANEPLHNLRPISLYIFGSQQYVTSFEKLSYLLLQAEIESTFDISVNKRVPFDDLLNAFRNKVQYFAMSANTPADYAHLTFYQFNNQFTGSTFRDFNKIPSGISLNGLLADLPSYLQDQTYITGFGSQYVLKDNRLISISKAYNALGNVVFSKDPFAKERGVCTTIDPNAKKALDGLYEHSQWVVFVDPHFDLTFFKDDDDLVLVHYSDQYSNASGFDAITVTRKSNQYRHLLDTILSTNKVTASPAQLLKVIDLYNAINGEWLIKMIGKKESTTRKEKISIPTALKLFLAYFDHPEIIWVPVSLEEILRVSGGAGLSKSEGLFSVSNLGAKHEHGDDLLMIGLFEKDGDLHVQFYPVEVKIGINASPTLEKGRLQARRSYQLIYDHLNDDTKAFESAFYRSFFAKLAIMNANKMSLYDIWPSKKWSKVTEDYRARLLNDEFAVTTALSAEINHFAVIAFTQSAYKRDYELESDGILLTHFETDAYKFLIDEIDDIKHWLLETPNSINTQDLMCRRLPDLSLLAESQRHEQIVDLPEPDIKEEEIDDFIPSLATSIDSEEVDQSADTPLRILFGHDINDANPIYWYPTDTAQVLHSNTGIIGTMGTGKTQFTKSLITQLYREQQYNVKKKPIGILIFDYKGDYINTEFVEATNAKVFNLFQLPFNPLSVDVPPDPVPLLPLHVASTLQETIALAFGLGPKQKALLKEVIMAAYEDRGIRKEVPETWTKQAPTISEVYEKYVADDRPIDSLHAALTQLYDYQIFQPDGSKTVSLYDLLDGVVVIKLAGYSADLQNLVVAITLDAFYSQMQKNGHSLIDQQYRQLSKFILVDEADNFLSKNFVSIRKILKEGREYGVGTFLSTQFLNHFSTGDNEYAQYILTWIVHRVNDIKAKDVESLFAVHDKDQKEQLGQLIKKLEKHFSVVNLAGSKPILIEDYPFWKLIS